MAENTQQEDLVSWEAAPLLWGDLGAVERGPAVLLLIGLAGEQLF